VTWNVAANATSGVTGSMVYDNGFPMNSVPAAPTSVVTYLAAPSGVPLFNGGSPSYLDMEQGDVGDCWLDASLAEVAARDPSMITSMFTYDGTIVDSRFTVGFYTVRFYNAGGSPVYVEVDTELPLGGAYYNQVTNDLGTSALWPALAERAYAEANGLGYVASSNDNQDSYNALNSGYP
jgi:Calpain family cysteine protease